MVKVGKLVLGLGWDVERRGGAGCAATVWGSDVGGEGVAAGKSKGYFQGDRGGGGWELGAGPGTLVTSHKMAGGSNIDASSAQIDLLEFRR